MLLFSQLLAVVSIIACLPTLPAAGDTTLTVRSDGTGNFTSIQAALDSCTPGSNPNLGRVTLLLKGLFFEAIEVYSNFTGGVDFVGTGAGPLEALIIDNRPGTVYSWLSATVKVDCNDFSATNVAFANNASNYNHSAAGQSLALYLGADRAALDRCALLGGQDTLYTGTGRVWLRRSFVNGSVDSIYGEGSAVLDDCTVTITDHVTAQRGNGSTGYLFRNCTVAPAGGLQTDLGRPWGPNATVVYKNCWLGEGIIPGGWYDWGHGCTNHSSDWCAGVTYAEFESVGPGADPAARVWWSQQLTPAEADAWTPARIMGTWNPWG